MLVFITKYALKSGIIECDAEVCDGHPNMIKTNGEYGMQYFLGEGREWHRSMESAIRRAEELRMNRIDSLMRSIRKLEAMRFGKDQK